MKRLYAIISVLLLTTGLMYAEESQKPERRTLAVTGTADITVSPDICYISFAVETNNRKAGDAYRENVELMNRINAAIKAQGVEAKDMQTTNFSISPQYQYTEKRRIFQGYRVYNTLFIAVRNLSKVPDVLDAAIEAGALDVGGITFTVEDSKRYTEDVRKQALRDARKKADESAQILGFKLGIPITVSESEPYGYDQYYNKSLSGMVARGEADMAPAPSIEAGQLKLSRTVYVTYEILPL